MKSNQQLAAKIAQIIKAQQTKVVEKTDSLEITQAGQKVNLPINTFNTVNSINNFK